MHRRGNQPLTPLFNCGYHMLPLCLWKYCIYIIDFHIFWNFLKFRTMSFVVEFGMINSYRTWSVLVCRMRDPCLHIWTRSIVVTSVAIHFRFFCAKYEPVMSTVKPKYIQEKVFVKSRPVSKSSSSKIEPHEDPSFFPSHHTGQA
jgi:hypothetical protein